MVWLESSKVRGEGARRLVRHDTFLVAVAAAAAQNARIP
jgi:hypothetical protein